MSFVEDEPVYLNETPEDAVKRKTQGPGRFLDSMLGLEPDDHAINSIDVGPDGEVTDINLDHQHSRWSEALSGIKDIPFMARNGHALQYLKRFVAFRGNGTNGYYTPGLLATQYLDIMNHLAEKDARAREAMQMDKPYEMSPEMMDAVMKDLVSVSKKYEHATEPDDGNGVNINFSSRTGMPNGTMRVPTASNAGSNRQSLNDTLRSDTRRMVIANKNVSSAQKFREMMDNAPAVPLMVSGKVTYIDPLDLHHLNNALVTETAFDPKINKLFVYPDTDGVVKAEVCPLSTEERGIATSNVFRAVNHLASDDTTVTSDGRRGKFITGVSWNELVKANNHVLGEMEQHVNDYISSKTRIDTRGSAGAMIGTVRIDPDMMLSSGKVDLDPKHKLDLIHRNNETMGTEGFFNNIGDEFKDRVKASKDLLKYRPADTLVRVLGGDEDESDERTSGVKYLPKYIVTRAAVLNGNDEVEVTLSEPKHCTHLGPQLATAKEIINKAIKTSEVPKNLQSNSKAMWYKSPIGVGNSMVIGKRITTNSNVVVHNGNKTTEVGAHSSARWEIMFNGLGTKKCVASLYKSNGFTPVNEEKEFGTVVDVTPNFLNTRMPISPSELYAARSVISSENRGIVTSYAAK